LKMLAQSLTLTILHFAFQNQHLQACKAENLFANEINPSEDRAQVACEDHEGVTECDVGLSVLQHGMSNKKSSGALSEPLDVKEGMKTTSQKAMLLEMLKDPNWFVQKKQELQLEADNLTFFINKCNAGKNPSKALVDESRVKHASCRTEQQALNASGMNQSCLHEKEQACNSVQSLFEEAYCNYAKSTGDYCIEVENCYNAAASLWDPAKAMVEQHESNLKELFIQHSRVKCKIDHWPLSDAQKASCASSNPDTTSLDILYPTKPALAPCVHPVAPVPGDSTWSEQEYSTSWKALVQPVTPCKTASPGPPGWVKISGKYYSPPEKTHEKLIGQPGFPPGAQSYCQNKSPDSHIMTRDEAEEYLASPLGGDDACDSSGKSGCGTPLSMTYGYTTTTESGSHVWFTNYGWYAPAPDHTNRWFTCVKDA